MNVEKIQNIMERAIDTQVAMMLKDKPADRQFLNQDDIRRLGCDVEGIWLQHCGEVPTAIKASVLMANTVMAGDFASKTTLIRHMLSTVGAVGGIAAILGGVGTILGWGTGVMTAISTAIFGRSLTGPLAFISLGAVATIIAGYFMFSNMPEEELSRKAIQVLREGIKRVLPDVWNNYAGKWSN